MHADFNVSKCCLVVEFSDEFALADELFLCFRLRISSDVVVVIGVGLWHSNSLGYI